MNAATLEITEMKTLAFLTLLAVAAPAAAPSVRLEGRALGQNFVSDRYDAWNDAVSLMVNSDKDRVGASFTACATRTGGDDVNDCGVVDFIFDGLTIDKRSRTIKYGDEVVGKLGGKLRSDRLVDGWTLVVTRTPQVVDGGFERWTTVRIAVALVKN